MRVFLEREWRFILCSAAIIVTIALLSLVAGCSFVPLASTSNKKANGTNGTAAPTAESAELNVSAAASLEKALKKLAAGFEQKENAKLVFNLASSGDLQAQIEQGAPADIFISAANKQMDALEEKGLIDSASRSNLLGNELVLIVPEASNISINKLEDLAQSKDIERIAMGDPDTVPAGKYAKESLEKMKVWEAVQAKIIPGKDVRQILSYIETGNTDIGFIFRSDAESSNEAKIIYSVPSNYHKPIVYPGAVLKDAEQPDLAAKFLKYLKSDEAQQVFKEFGFKIAVK